MTPIRLLKVQYHKHYLS